MTSNRFFISQPTEKNSIIRLVAQEHHHISRVVRSRIGDAVYLFDAGGNEYLARIQEIRKSETRLIIQEKHASPQAKIRLTLAQSLLKMKSWESILQKTTEWGAHDIIPIFTERTVIKLEDRVDKKLERWQKIILEASKQSGRSHIPIIRTPCRLMQFLKESKAERKIYLSEEGGPLLRDVITIKAGPVKTVSLLVGPEGGWSKSEIHEIENSGFESASLGPWILRAENAAVSGIAILSHFWTI